MRARNISTRLCTTRVGARRSGNTRAKLSAKPRRRSAIARSITPPFEVRRPPSKAAVTFLARTAGNENGRIVSSVMAGVAFAVEGDGVGFATESYAASALYTTLASLSAALRRIRRVSIQTCERRGFDRRSFVDRKLVEQALGLAAAVLIVIHAQLGLALL